MGKSLTKSTKTEQNSLPKKFNELIQHLVLNKQSAQQLKLITNLQVFLYSNIPLLKQYKNLCIGAVL